ncbi:hypothetical protein ACFL2V_12730 [Pseudomonadota bacterium]
MEALIGLSGVALGSVITGIVTWTITKQKTLADLINVDKQIESSYRQQRAQLEATAKTTQQQIHAQVILAERMKWIGTLRESIAQFQGVLFAMSWVFSELPRVSVLTDKEKASLDSEAVLYSKICLLLNPNEEDHLALMQLMNDAMNEARDGFKSGDGHKVMGSMLRSAQEILKREWERVKKGQ